MGLHLIYFFQSSQNQNESWTPARYKVVHFFSDEGFVSDERLRELAKSDPHANVDELTFLSLEDLKAFASRVSEDRGGESVRLLSVQDYNIGLDGARDLAELRQIFVKYGETVEATTPVKKKGLLGKLFS
jgi:hypothetical protein